METCLSTILKTNEYDKCFRKIRMMHMNAPAYLRGFFKTQIRLRE